MRHFALALFLSFIILSLNQLDEWNKFIKSLDVDDHHRDWKTAKSLGHTMCIISGTFKLLMFDIQILWIGLYLISSKS